MLSAQKLLSVAALGLFAFCGKSKEVPPINPTKVFTQVEAAITTTYFSGDPAPPLEKLYGNAVAALDAKETPDMKGTIKAIESQGPDKVRERTYRALNAFLSELPGGNDFTRAEGLLMSEDKSRQAGIGILLMQEGPGKFIVLDTLESSPAQAAGVKPGSVVKSIDGLEVANMDLEEVAGRIRGAESTDVRLGLLGSEPTIKRSKLNFINYSNATWLLTTGGQVEIVALRTAVPGTATNLEQFMRQMGKRSAVILDLRKLQSGDFSECFKIADLLVGKKKMGELVQKNGAIPMESTADSLFTGPIYVILGKHSSSAADVVAMALRSSLEVNLIGVDRPGLAYFAENIPLDGGIVLKLTKGFVADERSIPLPKRGLKMDVNIDDYLPLEPPGDKPSEADPAHRQLRTMLGLAR